MGYAIVDRLIDRCAAGGGIHIPNLGRLAAEDIPCYISRGNVRRVARRVVRFSSAPALRRAAGVLFRYQTEKAGVDLDTWPVGKELPRDRYPDLDVL